MIAVLLGLQALTMLAVVVLLRRRPGNGAIAAPDARMERLLAADLPGQLARVDGRAEALDRHVREELTTQRREAQESAQRALAAAEVLRATLTGELNRFRTDNLADAERLRGAVEAQIKALTEALAAFSSETAQRHLEHRDVLHTNLTSVRREQAELGDKLRATVEQRLDKLNVDNAAKLEEMRATVDEKLQKTLHSRLTESFGAVTDQLTKVHAGLGEMNSLTTGVNDLNRIFSNVKSRGGFAEVQLGNLLEQVLAPGQFVRNARVKENSLEVVEFAVKFPSDAGDVLLPIDAKFPREDWERLESAYETGTADEVDVARKAFDAAIRTEGKRICSKYIHEPVTTPYAIMFLPTEGLYAEVLRRDGLQSDLHLNCRVMVAGPSNLYALLTSFQLGFRMLNLQKKGDEVWKVLAKTQTEFKTFETLMGSMEKQVGTVQNTIQKLGVRTRAINRTLRDVSEAGTEEVLPGGFDGLLPMLAANEDDESL